ncbi:ATP-binding cassette domain-containing protein [Streptococcus thermophilus]|jgi:ABC-2 type transport system ATP-binding protein|nr:ATP-binding cassette domain-containing protein [Streptococcus thermophilus]MCE2061227.1 ATP-binding cassette domain-containing protein [Streptococcus thermophilus]MCE2064475.1 ATP-binding cassette domain-containing protein [Streptococcus thermophilus]MCE2066242.1 ATP-binding cassette domain-containing protein [Streptococcus thermophilus]MCE2072985.1 ATP-binding cassette domain-containing protein [Streptococcus thermophilus]
MKVKFKNFSKAFRSRSIFSEQNISIDLDNGKIAFLTGNNGSGKSTLMKLLAGILQITSGEIEFEKSMNFISWSKFHCYYMPSSEKGLTHKLTGLENIVYLCALKGNSKKDTLVKLKKYSNIFLSDKLLDMRVGEMSTGQKRLIHILAAFCSPCKILLFDEPSIGLDSENEKILIDLIRESKNKSDRKFIIVSHEKILQKQLMEEEYFVDDKHNILKRL